MSNPPQPRWGKEWERRGLELHKAVAEQAEEPQGRATRTDVTSGWQPCSLHLLVGLRWYERELFCARYETPSRTIRDICSLLAASDYQLLDRRWQSVSAIPTVRQLVSCFSDRAASLRILVSASLPHPRLPCLAPRLSHLAVITRLIDQIALQPTALVCCPTCFDSFSVCRTRTCRRSTLPVGPSSKLSRKRLDTNSSPQSIARED